MYIFRFSIYICIHIYIHIVFNNKLPNPFAACFDPAVFARILRTLGCWSEFCSAPLPSHILLCLAKLISVYLTVAHTHTYGIQVGCCRISRKMADGRLGPNNQCRPYGSVHCLTARLGCVLIFEMEFGLILTNAPPGQLYLVRTKSVPRNIPSPR